MLHRARTGTATPTCPDALGRVNPFAALGSVTTLERPPSYRQSILRRSHLHRRLLTGSIHRSGSPLTGFRRGAITASFVCSMLGDIFLSSLSLSIFSYPNVILRDAYSALFEKIVRKGVTSETER